MQEGNTAVALAMVTPGYDQDPASGVADYTTHQDQAQFEADKRAVYKHPLFPLLALLFERCEQATQSSDNSTSESFNMDIQAFVQHQERDRKPFLINDPEIDGLVSPAAERLFLAQLRSLLRTICILPAEFYRVCENISLIIVTYYVNTMEFLYRYFVW